MDYVETIALASEIEGVLNWLAANWGELAALLAIVLGAALGIGVVLWLVSRGVLSRMNRETSTVVGQFARALADSQTALKATAETLSRALSRETELTRKIIDLENGQDAVNDKLRRAQLDNEQTTTRLSAEITRLQALTKRQEEEIQGLKQASARKDAQMEQLRDRVQTLERQLAQRDRQIADLETALGRSEQDKQELVDELRRLEGRLNGKADKASEAPGAVSGSEQTSLRDTTEETQVPGRKSEESIDKSAEDAGEKDS